MDNQFYRSLMLPINLRKEGVFDDYASEVTDPTKNKMWRIEGGELDRVLTEAGREWLAMRGCRIDLCEMFYIAPHNRVKWHIDISGTTPVYDYVKINIVEANTSQWHMDWGREINPGEHKVGYNGVGSPHVLFEDNEIETLDTYTYTGAAIVNVGVPHRAINESDVAIWCCCLIPKRGAMRVSVAEADMIFRDVIVPML